MSRHTVLFKCTKAVFSRRVLSVECGYTQRQCNYKFVGVNKNKLFELKLFTNYEPFNEIYNYLATQGITFHFIPPRSPHFGWLWKASIKSVYTHII